MNTIRGDEDDGDDCREPEFPNYMEGPMPTKHDVDVLYVVEKQHARVASGHTADVSGGKRTVSLRRLAFFKEI